jgi:hypothetical protein
MKKNLWLILICAFFLGCGLDDDNAISGTLRYNTEKERWEINHYIEGTFDSVDVYIIKNYEVTIPTDSYREVKAFGKYYKSDEQAAWGGLEYYIIEVERLIFI